MGMGRGRFGRNKGAFIFRDSGGSDDAAGCLGAVIGCGLALVVFGSIFVLFMWMMEHWPLLLAFVLVGGFLTYTLFLVRRNRARRQLWDLVKMWGFGGFFVSFLIALRGIGGEPPSNGLDVFPWQAIALLGGTALLIAVAIGIYKVYEKLDRWSKGGPK